MAKTPALRSDGTKRCTKCCDCLPVSKFYTTGKKRNGDPKYNSWCKACSKKKQAEYHIKKWGAEALQFSAFKRTRTVETYLAYLLQKARRRDVCEITVSDVVEIWNAQNGRCALTGWEMTRILGQGSIPTNASIDRINSNEGYTKYNVQLVCRCVNVAKSDLSLSEFVRMCRDVSEKANAENTRLAA